MRFKHLFAAIGVVASTFAMSAPAPARADDAYLGQVIMVGFNFCPRGTMEADGRLLPINQNTALFSLLGTTYGGDGRTTFALPDLRGRVPVGQGAAPGLNPRRLGEKRSGAAHATPGNSNEIDGTAELSLLFCVVTDGVYPARR